MAAPPVDTAVEAPRAAFLRDGVVLLRGALDAGALALAEQAFAWSLAHPGPGARPVLQGLPGAFYQDHANPAAWPVYRPLLCDAGLGALVAALLDSRALWLLYEQIWLKEGAATLPTPWHQDLPYVPMAGEQMATVWLNLDPVPRAHSLEFIAGSHRGPLYNPTAFDAADPRAAMYAPGVWPELPDIAAAPERWPTLAWEIVPGDLVVFHPAVLHGGAPTAAGARRRTISLRFFGDDTCCAPRPEDGLQPVDRAGHDPDDPMAAMARLPAGTPFRHPGFQRVR